MSKLERMTIREAYEVMMRQEPVDYCFGGSRIRYAKITEVGIRCDDHGLARPFATPLDENEKSTLRTKLRYVERVCKEPLLTRESTQPDEDENITAVTGERAGDQRNKKNPQKKANLEIRRAAEAHAVRHWQIALALGITAETFSRKLRKEFDPETRDRILKIIAELERIRKEEANGK